MIVSYHYKLCVNAAQKSLRLRAGANSLEMTCSIGKNGYCHWRKGREGDGKTPLGEYVLRFGLYRPDRIAAPRHSRLPFWEIRPNDGWCDDPKDPAYNRFIRRPYPASHEILWREDMAYDLLLVISHNDAPPQPGLGSAIFIHIARPDFRPTLGCIALSPNDISRLLPYLHCGMAINILDS